jgi:hypothetical protein
VRQVWPRLLSWDILAPPFAVALTALAADRATEVGSRAGVLPFAGLLFLGTVMGLTVLKPHILVAVMIPAFVATPMLKALVVPWIGPLKDALVVASAAGIVAMVLKRRATGETVGGDAFALAAAFGFLGLYVLNLGGSFERDALDSAWVHGVRLTAEPVLLLMVGLLLPQPMRAFRWGMISLVATAVGVALIGLWQQRVGAWGLVDMGYEWDTHVRTIGDRLRSFGSLDDPFAYAAFLLTGLVAVAFWMRRVGWAVAFGLVILAGLAFGYVRTSALVVVALIGLWLGRRGHVATAALVLVASVVAGIGVFVAHSEVSETRAVQANPNTYLTINGRTQVWQTTLTSPEDWLLGLGVGEVGTAAQRAEFGVYRTAAEAQADADLGNAVDNGYLATIADVGILGLVLLLALLVRLGQLAYRAAMQGISAGWVALALLLVLLLDALTRTSFTAFPTAYAGLLLIGLALNAADAEQREAALQPED